MLKQKIIRSLFFLLVFLNAPISFAGWGDYFGWQSIKERFSKNYAVCTFLGVGSLLAVHTFLPSFNNLKNLFNKGKKDSSPTDFAVVAPKEEEPKGTPKKEAEKEAPRHPTTNNFPQMQLVPNDDVIKAQKEYKQLKARENIDSKNKKMSKNYAHLEYYLNPGVKIDEIQRIATEIISDEGRETVNGQKLSDQFNAFLWSYKSILTCIEEQAKPYTNACELEVKSSKKQLKEAEEKIHKSKKSLGLNYGDISPIKRLK